MRYLEKVIQTFAAFAVHDGNAEWARECHLAWMSVNTGWRSLVTDELMKRYEQARDFTEDLILNIHPLLAMVNPTVAPEMDLLEALKYLVEVKGIDINAKRWVGIRQLNSSRFHLIATAIREDSYDTFQYLMSADAIDIYSPSLLRDFPADEPPLGSPIFCNAINWYIEDEKKKRFFDAFVKHAKFRANRRFLSGPDMELTCLHYLMEVLLKQHQQAGVERVLDAVECLLDVGADPELEFHDLPSPLKFADGFRAAVLLADVHWVADALSKAIRIMSEHAKSS